VGLFLRLEAVIWVGVGMVMSFLGAFALMPFLDITINLSSLMGFILVLGIVVDDAIVISESCDSYRQQGLNPLDAAIRGTKRMAVPITFGVLTTVCAFLPMAFDSSDWGSMFRPIALVFITVMLIALVETKLILPSHLATPFLGRAGDLLAPIHRVSGRALRRHRLPSPHPVLRRPYLHRAGRDVRRAFRAHRIVRGGPHPDDLLSPRRERTDRLPPHHARWHPL
jgi:multidrug efflux pump subunit AcrB